MMPVTSQQLTYNNICMTKYMQQHNTGCDALHQADKYAHILHAATTVRYYTFDCNVNQAYAHNGSMLAVHHTTC
eukprot:18807-Heterococcus_DN1.PRE.1